MDPTKTFTVIFDAMRLNDYETARKLALALKAWLDKGGFYPIQYTPDAVNAYLASVLVRTAGSDGPAMLFSLVCWYCDAGQGIATEELVMEEGWTEIEPAPQLLQANYLGVCPDCRPSHEADSND